MRDVKFVRFGCVFGLAVLALLLAALVADVKGVYIQKAGRRVYLVAVATRADFTKKAEPRDRRIQRRLVIKQNGEQDKDFSYVCPPAHGDTYTAVPTRKKEHEANEQHRPPPPRLTGVVFVLVVGREMESIHLTKSDQMTVAGSLAEGTQPGAQRHRMKKQTPPISYLTTLLRREITRKKEKGKTVLLYL